jgi:hypothetical protein
LAAEPGRVPPDTVSGKREANAPLLVDSLLVTATSSKRILALSLLLCGSRLDAQHESHAMSGASMPLGIPWTRLGSGTSWIPDAAPMYAAHRTTAGWTLMLHGAAFAQYDRQNSPRGDAQLGLVDWEMLMALRQAAGGVVRLNAMTSLQPLVLGASGYPMLLQTGGSRDGIRFVNRQHPHQLIGELAAAYDRSLTSDVAAGLYVAAVGEPAIGPPAFSHRPAGEGDPFAPIGHHWQDATHQTFGVITAGVYSRRAKLEGSAFNAREPDGDRLSFDYRGARLDSYGGRFTLAPNPNVTLSAWAAYLFAHDRIDGPIGMQRYGASLVNVTPRPNGGNWSSGVVWGINVHHHGARVHNHGDSAAATYNLASALLVESAFDVTRRLSVFGRVEEVEKSADELGFLGGDLTEIFPVRALSLGGSYDIAAKGSALIGVGARGTLYLLPETLRTAYQGTRPTGFAVFLRVRPRAARI